MSSGARTFSSRWIGRAGDVGLARAGRRSHHPVEVLNALAVALGPRRRDVAVAVLADGAAKAVLGVVGHREQGHVGAVARAEDPQPLAVHPVERAQEVRGGEAVLRVADAPVVVVEPLELAPVSRRAAEVHGEPGVAPVHEVLSVTVPGVRVGVRRPAVRVHDRRHGPAHPGVARAHEEARDLAPVEGGEHHVLERGVRRRADRAGTRRVDRARLGARLHRAQLRGGGVVLVGRHDRARGGPVRVAPGAALGHQLGRTVGRAHHHEVEAVAPAAHRHEPVAVRVPLGLCVVGPGAREPALARPVARRRRAARGSRSAPTGRRSWSRPGTRRASRPSSRRPRPRRARRRRRGPPPGSRRASGLRAARTCRPPRCRRARRRHRPRRRTPPGRRARRRAVAARRRARPPRRAATCRRARRRSRSARPGPRPGSSPPRACAAVRPRRARATRGPRPRRRPSPRRARAAAPRPPSTAAGRGRSSGVAARRGSRGRAATRPRSRRLRSSRRCAGRRRW